MKFITKEEVSIVEQLLLIVGIVPIVIKDDAGVVAVAAVAAAVVLTSPPAAPAAAAATGNVDGVNSVVDNGIAKAVVVIVVATVKAVVEIVNLCFVADNLIQSLLFAVSCCRPIIWLIDGHVKSVAGATVVVVVEIGCKIALVAAAIARVDVVFVLALVSMKLPQETLVLPAADVVTTDVDVEVTLLTGNVAVLPLATLAFVIQMSDSLL